MQHDRRRPQLAEAVRTDHFAQFFDSPESRAQHIAAYVAAGLNAGERLILVLHSRHWADVLHRLAEMSAVIDRARETGFGDPRRAHTLRAVCDTHHHVHAASADMLSSFLLTTHVNS